MDVCEEKSDLHTSYGKRVPSFSVSLTIYYHMYLQQYGKYLVVNLKGSKATNRKQEKFSCLCWRLNPEPFSSESSALPSEPSRFTQCGNC